MKSPAFILLSLFLLGLPGMFSVNATTVNNTFYCDTSGHQTETAHHYNIGGHLFAGEYPINNPMNTGDTGIVFLYRIINNYIIPIDTSRVTTLGYFTFIQALEGEYLIKAELTKKSTHSKKFFPTYLINSLKWNLSDRLSLIDSNKFETNIHLVASNDSLSGPASMNGFVMQSLKDPGSGKLTNAEIVLFNESMDPQTFSFSDNTGNFSFSNLPYGIYFLMVEATGRYSAMMKIILDENHPSLDSIKLEVFNHAPASIQELFDQPAIKISPIFPNPAKEVITFAINSVKPETLELKIFSMEQRQLLSTIYLSNGVNSFTLPIGNLPKGTYFLVIQTDDKSWKATKLFVKD